MGGVVIMTKVGADPWENRKVREVDDDGSSHGLILGYREWTMGRAMCKLEVGRVAHKVSLSCPPAFCFFFRFREMESRWISRSLPSDISLCCNSSKILSKYYYRHSGHKHDAFSSGTTGWSIMHSLALTSHSHLLSSQYSMPRPLAKCFTKSEKSYLEQREKRRERRGRVASHKRAEVEWGAWLQLTAWCHWTFHMQRSKCLGL